MSAISKIEWCDRTWNPVRGCAIVSPGCINCYAMKQAHRFSGPGRAYEGLTKITSAGPQWTGKIRTIDAALGEPQRWKQPQRVFVNSMSDLFHTDVPDEFIAEVWRTMATISRHTYQILTKRPERFESVMPRIVETFGVLPNVWLGVSCENQEQADKRIPELLQTPAAVRFISAEPLLGPIALKPHFPKPMFYCRSCGRELMRDRCDKCHTFDNTATNQLIGIDWVIVGGESGPKARPCEVGWVRSIIEQCQAAGVSCFVKQLGSNPHDSRAPVRDLADALAAVRAFIEDRKGCDMSEWPADLRVREFPSEARR